MHHGNLKLALPKEASFYLQYVNLHHKATCSRIQPYLDDIQLQNKSNKPILNPNKTICTLFILLAKYNTRLNLQINNIKGRHALHLKILCFDTKLTYNVLTTRKYASIIWSPLASQRNITKLRTAQNTALWVCNWLQTLHQHSNLLSKRPMCNLRRDLSIKA